MEFLQKTKTQIANLSKRAASATKSGLETTTETIQSKVVETKERSKRKKEEKNRRRKTKSKGKSKEKRAKKGKRNDNARGKHEQLEEKTE